MQTASRSLSQNADSGRELPRIPALEALYRKGVKFRHGQVMMIVGRSGSQKSGLALWLAANWGLRTLYFSADMSAATASMRVASTITGHTTEEVEANMDAGGRTAQQYRDALRDLSIRFSFGSPISWRVVEQEITAEVELFNDFPEVIIFDNLMDFEGGAESDYTAQMEVMALSTELARNTGSVVLLMHHASDKGIDARTNPFDPPGRGDVKGGLSEKPELSLSVALDPNTLEFKVACIKQRSGPSDPTARSFARLKCEPELTRFHAL